jgi:signal transduction histidine kinase
MGSVLQERARRTEIALAEERAHAMAALAASERRRAEAEPLAAAGSRAVAAAHDMSGPIAAIRANLGWLDEALRDGRVSAADEELPAVVREARAAVEALVRALGDLRRASDVAKRTRAPGERTAERPVASTGTGE